MADPTIVISSFVEDPSEEAVRRAVTSRQPDSDVHPEDIAWWLALQERIEIRAELAASGLL